MTSIKHRIAALLLAILLATAGAMAASATFAAEEAHVLGAFLGPLDLDLL